MSRAGIGAPRLSFDFELQAMPAVSRALEKCLADLRAEWGMVDGKLPEPAEQPRPLVPLGALFKPDDYPYDAIVANQSGQVRLMVMIDERGTVLDCVALETSGIASVDAISCNIVVGRARFKPALDADGKPVKSTYLAVIDWRIVDR